MPRKHRITPLVPRTAQEIWDAFVTADDVWQKQLQKAFGGDAGDARYDARGRGEPATPLRAAYMLRSQLSAEWEALPNDDRKFVVRYTRKRS